ncbi:MAG: hypothetical protein HQL51_04345 [Magnetococcales bacterium]|nr:hypothetical protein [Magnetococcales bacterium]
MTPPVKRSLPHRSFVLQRIFVGAEGQSELALVKWLEQLCRQQNIPIHLETYVAEGGDTLQVISRSLYALARYKDNFLTDLPSMILLDSDRLLQDASRSDQAVRMAQARGVKLIFLCPKVEGLLYRLHHGKEKHRPTVDKAESQLKQCWPQYAKPPKVDDLEKHFAQHFAKTGGDPLAQLRAAAAHDPCLAALLELIKLFTPPAPSDCLRFAQAY